MRRLRSFRPLVLLLLPGALAAQAPRRPDPKAIVDSAIAAQGGEAALRAIRTIRMDVVTQWLRTNLGEHPFADAPSYERNVELRDYAANLWRNTRTFLPAGAAVDIVRDTVGGRALTAPNGAVSLTTLNLAYVDERRELWAFAPERTLLLAREAADLRALPDTVIDGVRHARVAATVDGFPAAWAIRRTDGLLAMVRFRADEDNDFGLAPWGVQEVETWFSGWAPVAGGALVARQRDVRRVGRPYKRMTLLAVTANAPAPADSFALADSIVTRYVASERKPMWDAAPDSATLVTPDFAAFVPWVGVGAAVRVGGQWALIETGQAEGAAAKVAAMLRRAAPGTRVALGIVTLPTPGNGGVRWFAHERLPLVVAPGAARNVRAMLGAASATARATTVTTARWVRVGTDSLWVEPLDLPDVPGALAVYAPAHRWLYAAPLVGRPALRPQLDALVARLAARGLAVEWVGTARAVRTSFTASVPAGR